MAIRINGAPPQRRKAIETAARQVLAIIELNEKLVIKVMTPPDAPPNTRGGARDRYVCLARRGVPHGAEYPMARTRSAASSRRRSPPSSSNS